MTGSEAIARIMWHAGLPFPSPDSDLPKDSMSAATWFLIGIEEACADLLRALDRLNIELNGSIPSVVGIPKKTNELPRQLVWSVERILRQMEEAREKSDNTEQRRHIASSVEKVKFWWRCVLDGDIDNIAADWEAYLHTR